MALSKRDLDDLKPWIDKTVQKFLGFSEPALVKTAINCLSSGYDKRKTTDKLSGLLDDKKATKLAEKLFETIDDLKVKNKNAKRKKVEIESVPAPVKKSRFEEEKVETPTPVPVVIPAPAANVPAVQPSPGQLTATQIKEMMLNAQKVIEERKKAIQDMTFPPVVPEIGPIAPPDRKPMVLLPGPTAMPELKDNKSRIYELTQQIQARLVNRANAMAAATTAAANLKLPDKSKPAPLILNEEGRTVDVSGKEIQLVQRVPTLKANIRAQRQEQFKIHQEKVADEVNEQMYFDPRVNNKVAVRPKRGFRFHEKGKFEQIAQRLRTKAQLEKLQHEIAQAAKKTGISSATKLALITPKKETKEGEIPEIEWWDTFIIKGDSYDQALEEENYDEKYEGITKLVEHPAQMKAPMETTKPLLLPVFLTKKERKKLRRQNRREAWKEKQEKIRLGLEPPPEPKVRMSNLMRVLGTQAVQDPSKIEAHVREQMAKRQKAHEEANAARKLTVDQRRAKKVKKIKEDTTLGVQVTVYRVVSLSNPSHKFKIEVNAKQLFMTGCVVMYRDVNVVVVEGGPKQQKKFKKLMMTRIKWQEDQGSKSNKKEKIDNKCHLVWEGATKHRSFGDMKFKACPTESLARDHFKKHGVEHYWDLAYSVSVLEGAEDN